MAGALCLRSCLQVDRQKPCDSCDFVAESRGWQMVMGLRESVLGTTGTQRGEQGLLFVGHVLDTCWPEVALWATLQTLLA